MKKIVNYKADMPTINNRIYTREALIEALDNSLPVQVTRNFDCDDYLGEAVGYTIEEDGTIQFEIELKEGITEKDFEDITFVSTGWMGDLKENSNEVQIDSLYTVTIGNLKEDDIPDYMKDAIGGDNDNT